MNMNTFRTIVIIVGILVAGAALNTTFAQDLSTYEDSHKKSDHVKIKHDRHKHKDAKYHKHEHKACVKSTMKEHKHHGKAHKHEMKASLKSHKKYGVKTHKNQSSDTFGRLE